MLSNFIESAKQFLIAKNFGIFKCLYLILLVYTAVQILIWTYRRLAILIEMKQFSMGAMFKLGYCLIFLLLTALSISNLFTSANTYRANPYIILIMSINLLYLDTTLSSNRIKEHKRSRLIVNSLMFAVWGIFGTIIFILGVSSVQKIPLCFSNSIASFGWEIYGKTTPFWNYGEGKYFTYITIVISNIFNFLCLLFLVIYSKIIPEIKQKLYSWKYILCIDLFILIRDLCYVSFKAGGYSPNGSIPSNIMGITFSICIFIIGILFLLFIRSEGKYDKNLKKLRKKTLMKDFNNVVTDYSKAKNLGDKVECVRRLKYLILRSNILETKIDIVKEVQKKSPGLYNQFTLLTNEEITLDTTRTLR